MRVPAPGKSDIHRFFDDALHKSAADNDIMLPVPTKQISTKQTSTKNKQFKTGIAKQVM